MSSERHDITIENATGGFRQTSDLTFSIKNFKVETGEQIALLGRSGSGKSTLLNLLAGFLPASSGSIKITTKELVGTTEAKRDLIRREHIGMIFQTYQLIDELSVIENVSLGQRFSREGYTTETSSQASHLLEKVGLSEKVNKRPSELSVGQRQRVAIARALIKKPDLILADEPTGALDRDTGESVCSLLQELSTDQKSSVLFVTHDEYLANKFPKQLEVSEILNWKESSSL